MYPLKKRPIGVFDKVLLIKIKPFSGGKFISYIHVANWKFKGKWEYCRMFNEGRISQIEFKNDNHGFWINMYYLKKCFDEEPTVTSQLKIICKTKMRK